MLLLASMSLRHQLRRHTVCAPPPRVFQPPFPHRSCRGASSSPGLSQPQCVAAIASTLHGAYFPVRGSSCATVEEHIRAYGQREAAVSDDTVGVLDIEILDCHEGSLHPPPLRPTTSSSNTVCHDPDMASSADGDAAFSSSSSSDSSARPSVSNAAEVYDVVVHLDMYCRARVSNCLARLRDAAAADGRFSQPRSGGHAPSADRLLAAMLETERATLPSAVCDDIVRHGSGNSIELTSPVREEFVKALTKRNPPQSATREPLSDLYRTTIRLPLPCKSILVAEGVALTSAADSVAAAAMHAERLLDLAGFPIYGLASKQRRHAEAARGAGRWAPMPGDSLKSSEALADAALPRPLWYRPPALMATSSSSSRGDGPAAGQLSPPSPLTYTISDVDAAEGQTVVTSSSQMEEEGEEEGPGKMRRGLSKRIALRNHRRVLLPECERGIFQLVGCVTNRQASSPYALLTPCVIDRLAIERMRISYAQHGKRFDQSVVVTPSQYDGVTYFTAVAPLPTAASRRSQKSGTEVGEVATAFGKATTEDTATILCAMHAELLMLAAGIRVFPRDEIRQRLHLRDHWRCGRDCYDAFRPITSDGIIDDENDTASSPLASSTAAVPPLPRPLKELSPVHNDFIYHRFRLSPYTAAERYVITHSLFTSTSAYDILEVNFDRAVPLTTRVCLPVIGATPAAPAASPPLSRFRADGAPRRLKPTTVASPAVCLAAPQPSNSSAEATGLFSNCDDLCSALKVDLSAATPDKPAPTSALSLAAIDELDDHFYFTPLALPGGITVKEARECLQRWQLRWGAAPEYVLRVNRSDQHRACRLLFPRRDINTTTTTNSLAEGCIMRGSEERSARDDQGTPHPATEERNDGTATPDLGVHGAIGVAHDAALAGALCTAHAIELLNYLGLPLFLDDPVRQKAYETARVEAGLSVPSPSANTRGPLAPPTSGTGDVDSKRLRGDTHNGPSLSLAPSNEDDELASWMCEGGGASAGGAHPSHLVALDDAMLRQFRRRNQVVADLAVEARARGDGATWRPPSTLKYGKSRCHFLPPVRDVQLIRQLQATRKSDFFVLDVLALSQELTAMHRRLLEQYFQRLAAIELRRRRAASVTSQNGGPAASHDGACIASWHLSPQQHSSLRMHCLIEDNTTRDQRCTAWFELPVPVLPRGVPVPEAATREGHLTAYASWAASSWATRKVCAVGRAVKVKDAERLAIFHAIMLLDELRVCLHASEAEHRHHGLVLNGVGLRPAVTEAFGKCWSLDGVAAYLTTLPPFLGGRQSIILPDALPIADSFLRESALKRIKQDPVLASIL